MRVDVFLAATGRAKSREAAKRLIEAGRVSIDGAAVAKASENVDETAEHRVTIAETDLSLKRHLTLLKLTLPACAPLISARLRADLPIAFCVGAHPLFMLQTRDTVSLTRVCAATSES